MGGGPVGAELAQFFSRLGTRVTIIDHGPHLLGRVHAEAGELIGRFFAEDGIDVRTNAGVVRVEPGVRLTLSDDSTVEAERLLVATGRRPNAENLGLEQLGVTIGRTGIEVDERCRAAENVWAIGDITGVALLTHVGKYQARIAAADMAGQDVRADYRAIPAGIFTDPEVATVGVPEGISARWELTATSRSSTYERPKRDGFVRLFADPGERVLVGAVAVGPQATEWLRQPALAGRPQTSSHALPRTNPPLPPFCRVIFLARRV